MSGHGGLINTSFYFGGGQETSVVLYWDVMEQLSVYTGPCNANMLQPLQMIHYLQLHYDI